VDFRICRKRPLYQRIERGIGGLGRKGAAWRQQCQGDDRLAYQWTHGADLKT
jgi:hypothetical protein